ncbi:MAG: sulfatase-like hydrolase/transferase [Candidatus Latescibacterota bacterium]|nr:MAG: sulfatase-like hydrolase/transferase [Candidatus Latescibacterota bacterium]
MTSNQTTWPIGSQTAVFLTIGVVFGLGTIVSVVGFGGAPLWLALRNALAYWLGTVAVAVGIALVPMVILSLLYKKSENALLVAIGFSIPVAALLVPDAIVLFSDTGFHDGLSPRGKLVSYGCVGIGLFTVLTLLFLCRFVRTVMGAQSGLKGERLKWVLGTYALGVLYLTVTYVADAVVTRRSGKEADERPNIVLIVVDAMRARSLGCYGGQFAVSPVIDDLAKNGLRIEGALSTGPVSVPAHASILLGQGVEEHGAFRNQHVLEGVAESVASRLREDGYWCFGICRNGLISADAGFDHGFGFYWSTGARPIAGAPVNFVLRQIAAVKIAVRLLHVDLTDWYAPAFLRKRNQPFFGFLQYMPVHEPYTDNRAHRWATSDRHDRVREAYHSGQFLNQTSRPTHQVARTHAEYLGSIDYANWLIARLLRVLDTRELLGNTVLIVTSDHGENLAEHGDRYAFGHGGYFNSTIEIPLVVSSPRLGFRGAVLKTLTGADRIADLIFDAAAEDSDLLAGRLQGVKELIEKPNHFAYAQPYFVLFDDSLKVVLNYDDPDQPPRVFRWRDDPTDRHDVSKILVAQTKEGVARLEQIVRVNNIFDALQKPVPVDEKRLRQLRALGYID